jgi:pyridinium-3,5-biscarboxylic acid mononucleotide sulfurtransferase
VDESVSVPAITAALDRVRARIASSTTMLVAFSGGADSALLAYLATSVLGDRALAVTAVSASLPETERLAAAAFARRHGIAHLQVHTDEGERPAYVANGPDRCYHCKSALLDALAPLAIRLGATIAIGTITDDLGDYRPGQRAATEHGAVTPLADAGIDKAMVRAASHLLGLETADKPAAACTASRVPYGEPVTPAVLAAVEAAERGVHALGFPVCRVRAHGGTTVARLEVPAGEIDRAIGARAALEAAILQAGFTFASLDLHGFASGRLNVLLPTITVGVP